MRSAACSAARRSHCTPQEIATGDLSHLDAAGFLCDRAQEERQITAFGAISRRNRIKIRRNVPVARIVISATAQQKTSCLIELDQLSKRSWPNRSPALNERLPTMRACIAGSFRNSAFRQRPAHSNGQPRRSFENLCTDRIADFRKGITARYAAGSRF